MKTLLLIGGSGFFGKSFLDSFKRGLLNQWDVRRVIVLSRKASLLLLEAPELVNSQVELFNGDICTLDSIPFADYVIHAAASTDSRNYIDRPELEKINILAGTYNYCKLAKNFHKKSKIVYCSSGAVYGQQPQDMEYLSEDLDSSSLDEMPSSKRDYASAKRDAEKEIENLALSGYSVSIARCFAFLGKYLPRNQHFAIGNFIQDGMNGNDISVKAISPVFRSYMHADDLVHWLMSIAQNANQNCPIYNVGSDEAISIINLSEIIAKKFNVSNLIPRQVEGPIDRYIPSIIKARVDLRLQKPIALDKAVDLVIQEIKNIF